MKKFFVLALAAVTICGLMTGCFVTHQPEIPSDTDSSVQPAADTDTSVTVCPLPSAFSPENIDNCTIAVSFDEGDIYLNDDGALCIDVTVFDYEVFDLVDINTLKPGDTLVIRRQNVTVETIEDTSYGTILINGGIENGGYELRTEENGIYFETGYSDIKEYYEVTTATFAVSQDFQICTMVVPVEDKKIHN